MQSFKLKNVLIPLNLYVIIQGSFQYLIQECAPQEQIDSILQSGFIIIAISDRILDQGKAGNPFKVINKIVLLNFQSGTQKYLSFRLRHSIVNTIENFFYYQPTEFTHHTLQYESQIESQTDENNYLLLVNFILDDRKINYRRTYDNILSIFGALSGLFDIFVLIAGFIMYPITKIQQNINLLNQIFSFEQTVSHHSTKIHDSTQLNRKKSLRFVLTQIDDKKTSQIEENLQKKGEINKELKQFFNQKQNRFKLDGFEKISVFFGGQKKKQFQYGIDKINNKLDIGFIIRKLIEVDKLKMILFNQQQCKLFDYIPKPTIPIKQKQRNRDIFSSYFSEEKDYQVKVLEAFEAYKISKCNQDIIDTRLLSLIDQEIKELFDSTIGILQLILILYSSRLIQIIRSKSRYNI